MGQSVITLTGGTTVVTPGNAGMDKATADATYTRWDGTNLRQNGAIVPVGASLTPVPGAPGLYGLALA